MKNLHHVKLLTLSCIFIHLTFVTFAQRFGFPTAKERATMEAALEYYKDPNSILQGTHDPEIIKQDSVYYLFGTGNRSYSSTDLINWNEEPPVFEKIPEWLTDDIIPGINERQGYWAPDVQYVNGMYYMYYCYSIGTKITSAIGVATNKTLHPSDPDYEWVDRGMIIHTVPNRDFFNAIDPNMVMIRNQGYLVFGSFWSGIKMVKLAPDLLSIAEPQEWHSLAAQPRSFYLDYTDPGGSAIEGAFIYQRPGNVNYFYLFASIDHCCRGLDSTYKVIVGRSRNIEGPYFDKEGNLLSMGGGTVVAEENERWAAVGHNSAYTMDGKSIIVMHGYDKLDNGRSKLIIREMKWGVDDWPTIDL
ncbi:MAG TPA: family 43 glycosylhydrolase [Draconibacterium sp.]|nr:family 43 glycosylhydrolase [Draconibacterium sp.]